MDSLWCFLDVGRGQLNLGRGFTRVPYDRFELGGIIDSPLYQRPNTHCFLRLCSVQFVSRLRDACLPAHISRLLRLLLLLHRPRRVDNIQDFACPALHQI